MKTVYVSGPIRTQFSLESDISRLSLISRRVALCRHKPVCPALMYSSFLNDPRFKFDLGWYMSFSRSFLRDADILCFVREPSASKSEITSFERDWWYDHGKGVPIPEDSIVDFLIHVK